MCSLPLTPVQYLKLVHVERFLEQYKSDVQQFLQTFQEIELLDEKSAHLKCVTCSLHSDHTPNS